VALGLTNLLIRRLAAKGDPCADRGTWCSARSGVVSVNSAARDVHESRILVELTDVILCEVLQGVGDELSVIHPFVG
jgi:hypothetical protein